MTELRLVACLTCRELHSLPPSSATNTAPACGLGAWLPLDESRPTVDQLRELGFALIDGKLVEL